MQCRHLFSLGLIFSFSKICSKTDWGNVVDFVIRRNAILWFLNLFVVGSKCRWFKFLVPQIRHVYECLCLVTICPAWSLGLSACITSLVSNSPSEHTIISIFMWVAFVPSISWFCNLSLNCLEMLNCSRNVSKTVPVQIDTFCSK